MFAPLWCYNAHPILWCLYDSYGLAVLQQLQDLKTISGHLTAKIKGLIQDKMFLKLIHPNYQWELMLFILKQPILKVIFILIPHKLW